MIARTDLSMGSGPKLVRPSNSTASLGEISLTPRAKSTIIVIAILIATFPVLIFISSRVIRQGFSELETADASAKVQMAVDALNSELQELDSKTRDWAADDDAYNFIAGRNPGYLDTHIYPGTIKNLRVNLIAYLNPEGQVVEVKTYDHTTGLEVTPTSNLASLLISSPRLSNRDSLKKGLSGIFFLDGKPLLVAAHPITPNNPNALTNGALIFGRTLDDNEIQRLANVTNLLLEIRPVAAPALPTDFQAAQTGLNREPIIVQPLDDRTGAAYTLLPDIDNAPSLILRVQLLRDIYTRGQLTLRVFVLAMVIIGVVFGWIGQSTLEKMFASQQANLETMGRYQAVVEQISEGMIQVDAGSKAIVEVNPAFSALLGYDPAGVIGKTLNQVGFQPTGEVDADLALMLAGTNCIIGERRYLRANGRQVDVEISSASYVHGGRSMLCIVIRDITARKEAEKALLESEERYQLATQGANDGLWDWDLKSNRMYFSARWKSMLGFSEEEIYSSPDEWLRLIHPDDVSEVRVQLDAHLNGITGHFQSEHRMLHQDGSYRWMLTRGLAVRTAEGKPYRMAGSQTDITERKQTEEQFRHDALHDALTNLPNRTLFLDRLSQAIERSRRRSDYLFALLFLDFDRFKVINDSLGHTIGDQLLVAGARRLETCLRGIDTIARMGGDEFVILIEHIESPRDAIRVAERVQEALKPPFTVQGHEVFISASTGIVMGNLGYESAEDALRDADIAMYRSKALGRSRYELFDPDLRSRAVARLELETDMRRAIERNEFVIHYQPILSLSSSHITGFEALIRWQHPTLGLTAPVDFIPVAEETGLIVPIGQWVLRESCRQMKDWQDRGICDKNLTISVNMSSKQFSQPELPDQIEEILRDTGLNIACLRLEITESVIMEAVESTTNMLKRLKAMGLQLDVDDFGTGYSSLSYLQQLPIDAVKIDRSFISKMELNGSNHGIVQAIVSLAHNLGMHVIAEGVEESRQMEWLQAMQCEQAQGFLFHRPMDSGMITGLLVEHSQDQPGQPAS